MTPLELDTRRPRIALVRLSSLGDVVRVLPLVASLRRRWPEGELTWIVEPGPRRLLGDHPAVDRFVVFPRGRPLSAHAAVWRRTRGRRHDLVLDLHRYFKAGLVTALLDAPVKLGFDRARSADLNWWFTTHRIPPGPRRHVQEEYFEFLEHLGVPVVREWPLPLAPEERRRQRAELDGLDEPLAVHPTSSTRDKDWPVERWARLVRRVRDELGMRPVLVGGRGGREERRARRIVELAGGDGVVDAREQDLRRLLRTVDGCAALVGPDSGPLHVAAALGVPAVGLYGFTDPTRHGPRGPLGRHDELVVDRFGPRPDGRPTDETRPGRMERVGVDEVLERIGRARALAADPGRGEPGVDAGGDGPR